jgi:uncharacterized membrane protein/protein-disulfide isomerase
MARKEMETTPTLSRARVAALTGFAALGLVASASSTWVHYQLLKNPAYSSFCDVSASVSCTEAYTSRFGSFAGVPVALFGVLFFGLVIGLIALCTRSASASPNLAGYIFALSSAGLAVVLYLAYASFVVLKAVCLLCVGTYIAIIGLFLLSGAATGYPMTSLPLAPAVSTSQLQQLEQYLAQQPRVPIMAPSDGAAVVIVKFNDYQCPPCRQTFMEYKSVFAKWAKDAPGKVKYMTRDYPLETQCNQFVPQDLHPAACEAAVAVRLAREKGKAEAMEEWIFANQPSLTPELVKQGVQTVAGVTDFDTRFPTTLQLVKADIAMGNQLKVTGTPTFFMNGIRLPGLRAEFLDAAIAWELKRLQADK